MNNDASTGTRIVLVRHGHVEGIAPPRFRGQTDLPLTVRGTRQAERTRDLVACLPRPAAAYASPLLRCMMTAEIIAQPLSLAVASIPSFLDIDYGEWQGRSYQEVEQADPERFACWFEPPHLAIIPGGETLLELARRVAETMRSIVAKHCGETVLLVGRRYRQPRDVIARARPAVVAGLAPAAGPLRGNLVTHDRVGGWRVDSMNEASHLQSLQ